MLGLPQHVQKELGEHPYEEAAGWEPWPTPPLTPTSSLVRSRPAE